MDLFREKINPYLDGVYTHTLDLNFNKDGRSTLHTMYIGRRQHSQRSWRTCLRITEEEGPARPLTKEYVRDSCVRDRSTESQLQYFLSTDMGRRNVPKPLRGTLQYIQCRYQRIWSSGKPLHRVPNELSELQV